MMTAIGLRMIAKASLLSIMLAVVGFVGTASAVSVDNFTISNFKIDYYLSKDSNGHSTLRVVERITADFPNYNQNKGLVREVPRVYDGHTVGFTLKSLKRGGQPEPVYDQYNKGDFRVIETGTDEYLLGSQVYEFTYELRDVTRYFKDTKSDELYWDTNGTNWRVPIKKIEATIHLEDAIKESLTGNSACYKGTQGSVDRCGITKTNDSTFVVTAYDLQPRDNVTIAIGFAANTFTLYQKTMIDKLRELMEALKVVWYGAMVIAGLMLVWLYMKWQQWSDRKRELGTIVPEYTAPKDASVTVSASIASSTKAFAAQLIDFAVRHYIKIYEIEKKGLFGSKDYELEITKDVTTLRAEEQEILRDIFSGDTAIGTRLKMSSLRNNTAIYKSTVDNDKKLKDLIRGTYGLRERDQPKVVWFKKAAAIVLLLSIFTLNPVGIVAAGLTLAMAYTLYPLTDKGLTLYRYLEGLKMYIKVAETERLKLLQSPEGAEKVGILDAKDPKQLVKLYEKVLPYAILFGQEKEWNNQLGKYYESISTQPDWYSGSSAAFNAASFSSAISGFSTASSYTSASSSTGGSSGGGSSGGGGGGGGGGGR